MTYFRFGTDDGGQLDGFRRSMPDDTLTALRDLLAAVRKTDEATLNGKSDGVYFHGNAERGIKTAVELLWGREVWDQISRAEDTEDDAGDFDDTDLEGDDRQVVQPDVATMSLFRRPKPKLSKRDRDAVNLALGRKR
jgi:hypothetical protein